MIVRIARVKVGNRQAPQHVQKPHPNKVGFLRLRAQSGHRGTEPSAVHGKQKLHADALLRIEWRSDQVLTSPDSSRRR